MKINITKLPPERWKEYKELRLASLKTDPTAWEHTLEMVSLYPDQRFQDRLANGLQDRGELNFFAEIEGKVIGMTGAFWAEIGKTAHHATIVSVYVLPEYRGQGIAKMLLAKVIDYLKAKQQFVKLKLTVVDGQGPALKMYEQFGFEPVGRLHKELFMQGQFYDEILMEKSL